MGRGASRAILVALALAGATGAAACGVCVEDRVAAVYDHGVAQAAARRGAHVAYIGLEGSMEGSAKTRRAVAEAMRSAGAIPGTPRISVESSSCSFAFDPSRRTLAAAVDALNRRLAREGLAAVPLRVLDASGRLRPP